MSLFCNCSWWLSLSSSCIFIQCCCGSKPLFNVHSECSSEARHSDAAPVTFQVRPVTAALHNGTTDSGICLGSAGIAGRLLGDAVAPRLASCWERALAPRPAHQDVAWRWCSAETEAAHTGVHSVIAPALHRSRRSPRLPFFNWQTLWPTFVFPLSPFFRAL